MQILRRTHQCVTLGGSSGSSLRRVGNGEIVGIHRGGIEGIYNFFIPLNEEIAQGINFQFYKEQKKLIRSKYCC